ncbi:MAG: malto-oligosyltrehalose trehalohydrolase [Acidobacteriaceae bacterium]|nr:malto-oligosyltrehalose trehalohydrolase [Acidobacteriaceae bacterium]
MHQFKIWAPSARTIGVKIDSRIYPLETQSGGWWSAEVEEAGPGTDYWFVVDGSDPIPDPRSFFQPLGIHGPSRIIDHSFPWTDDQWQPKPLSSAIIYEMHVGTFTMTGTFASAMERLDYLVDLGITHVELMPVNEFSGDWGWGYDGVDLYAPHHAYGSPEDLKRLIDACHSKGLGAILDVVYNHFGPAGNYLNRFGPYFTDAYKTPWGPAINFDHKGSLQVRRFFAENALMWLRDYHFDGLRLDAVHAYYDRSAIHFLEYLSSEVDALASQLGRHLTLIAESDLNDPRVIQPREASGYGIDAQWNDDFHHTLHSVLTGETNGYYEDFGSLAQLAKALRCGYVYDGIYSVHRDRLHGRPVIGLSGRHFLGYSQNHDQIGNRPRGERLNQLVTPRRQKIAAALVFTSPFVPMLFQGEEFAASTPFQYFTHHRDPDLARQVSEGRRNEFSSFGWKPEDVPDPQDVATLERSKLNWEEISEACHREILDWYERLIALRRSKSQLTDGRLDAVEVRFDEDARWLAMERGDIEVICNFGAERQRIGIRRNPEEVICSECDYALDAGTIELPADSVAILA